MPVSASSTYAEVAAQFDDNASYDLNSSVEQCKLFIAAGRILLRRTPQETEAGDRNRVRHDLVSIRQMLADAKSWLKANESTSTGRAADGSGYIHPDFRGFMA